MHTEACSSQASSLSFTCVEDNRLDFYAEHASFKVLVWMTLFFCGATSSTALLDVRYISPVRLVNPLANPLLLTPACLPIHILPALSIKMRRAESRLGRFGMNTCYSIIKSWSLSMPPVSIYNTWSAVLISIALHVLVSIAFVVQRLRRMDI